jgi:flagellar basal body rod protein FlgC
MSAIDTTASGLYSAYALLNVAASSLANNQTTEALNADVTTLGASALGATALGSSATNAAAAPAPTGSSYAPPLAYQPLQLVQYSNADVASGGASSSGQTASPGAYAAYAPSASYPGVNGQSTASNVDIPAQSANQPSGQTASPGAYAAYGASSSYAGANGQSTAQNVDLPAQIANQASALIQFQANLAVIQIADQTVNSVVNQTV